MNNLEQFKNTSDDFITNQYNKILDDVENKLYTRDLLRESGFDIISTDNNVAFNKLT